MATRDIDKMLRDLAQVRGFKLVKSRRRKPGGDFGRYGLKDAKTDKPCFGMGERGLKATAEDVEAFLRGQAKAEWKSSLTAPATVPKLAPRRGKRRFEADASPSRPVVRRPAAARVKPVTARPRPAPKPEKAESPKPKVELVIREATGADARELAALMEDPPTTRKIAATIAALAKQGRPVIVAHEGKVVGAVSYEAVTAVQWSAPLGRITFLTTAKAARRRGIGGKLLQEAETRLRKLGCTTFELINAIELSNANSFLRKHGYQRSGFRFARDAGKR